MKCCTQCDFSKIKIKISSKLYIILVLLLSNLTFDGVSGCILYKETGLKGSITGRYAMSNCLRSMELWMLVSAV